MNEAFITFKYFWVAGLNIIFERMITVQKLHDNGYDKEMYTEQAIIKSNHIILKIDKYRKAKSRLLLNTM
jgi:hypothetical protein